MRRKKNIRKTKRFDGKMQTKLIVVFCLILLAFAVLIFRLVMLNHEDGERYGKKVLSQQTYVSSALPYKRGDILDRNSTKLATSVAVYDLIIAPKTILSKEEYRTPTLDALISSFDVTNEQLSKILADSPESQYKVLLKNIDSETVKKFQELQEEDKKVAKSEKRESYIKGITLEKKYKRRYPLNNTACSIIGFTTSDNNGLWGLEGQYNEQLNGTAGREYGYFNQDSDLERTVKPAENGNTLVTTIDANIQSIVEKNIRKFMKKIGAKNAAALVMNPKTGEIYAMASTNSYDLNNPFDLTQFYTKAQINKMTEEEKTANLNRKWANYCISYTYEPGSTFKPLTIAAGLEEGIVTDKKFFTCDGFEQVADRRIKCVSVVGHGTLDLQGALMKSCNDVLMQVGAKLGKAKYEQYQSNFNIGTKTGIDLPGEETGMVHTGDNLGPVELATSSFGQGLTVNMVQIASAISSVVNGGHYYQPHVVKQILNDSGAVVKNIDPILVRQTVSEQTSELIRKYLLATVEEGTGATAGIKGYKIGGKTGTAEKFPRGNKKYLVSFIGCAPMNDPEVLVYVTIDEPKVKDQAHSTYAQEVTKDIMKDIFPFLNIYPDTSVEEKDKKTTKSTASPEPTGEDENDSFFDDPNAAGIPEEGDAVTTGSAIQRNQ